MSWRVLERTESRLVLRDRPWAAWGLALLFAAAGTAIVLVFVECATLRLERDRGGLVRGTLVRRRGLGKETIVFPPGALEGASLESSQTRIQRIDPEGGQNRVETWSFARVLLKTSAGPVPLTHVFRSGNAPYEDLREVEAFLGGTAAGSLFLERDERWPTLALSLLLFLPALLLAGRRALTVTADRGRGTVRILWRGLPWATGRDLRLDEIRSVWVVLGVPGTAWVALETNDGAPVPFRLLAISSRRAQEEAGDLLRGFLLPWTAGAAAPREALRPEAW
jgi:hypothetical protein